MLRQPGKQAHWGNTWDNVRGAGAVNWVGRVQRRSWPFLVSQMSLKEQDFANLFGDSDVKATDGWLARWKDRNIVYRKLHGEKQDADSASAED
ncbi:hypothetical protein AVEN_273842-1 [Araneus ventricosus]|uniref:HTH CENPB-type domain-containing protein n=1 Tax=Araneus ventricosus TaxID=182803 RepID=A0A4Y2L1D4_ARAVE|nr:hypothetical protein AVEN_273842-1 [Araneus ventricosus]